MGLLSPYSVLSAMNLQKSGTQRNGGSKGASHMKYRMATYKVICPATYLPLKLKLKRLTIPSAGGENTQKQTHRLLEAVSNGTSTLRKDLTVSCTTKQTNKEFNPSYSPKRYFKICL